MCLGRQAGSVFPSGHDDLQFSTQVEYGLGEDLVGAVRKTADANEFLVGQSGQLSPDTSVNQLRSTGVEPAMPGNRNSGHTTSRKAARTLSSSAVTAALFLVASLVRSWATLRSTRS